jgi:hypothetical protein
MEDKREKSMYVTPSIHVAELNYDAVLCMSDPTMEPPYDEGEDWL